MNTASILLRHDDSSGFLRRAGRAVLGSAAILIVGVGAMPAAEASAASSAKGHSMWSEECSHDIR